MEGQVWQKCGKEGCPARGWMWLEIWVKLLQTEIRDSAPSNRNCWRAARTLPECRRKERPPGVFHLHERGRGGAEPGPAHVPSRNPPLEDPPQFFGQIFWEKILEIKIVLFSIPEEIRVGRSDNARSDSGP